jgi:hypothetical protein
VLGTPQAFGLIFEHLPTARAFECSRAEEIRLFNFEF